MCRRDKQAGLIFIVTAGLLLSLAGCLAACTAVVVPPLPATVTPLQPPVVSPSLPAAITPSPAPSPTLAATVAAAAPSATPPAATATPPPPTGPSVTMAAVTLPAATPAATATGALPDLTPDAKAPTRWAQLPILMYHYVEPWPVGASLLRKQLTVPPDDFAAQMAYLHSQGFVTVSLYDLMNALDTGHPLPPKAIVLTFDDGYRTLMDYAVPDLKPYGYTGTVFVITQLMDQDFAQYLTWPQAEALYAAGWDIEPHSKTHPVLAGRPRDFQLYEMLGSIETVQAHTGRLPHFFAYPYGKWDNTTLDLARQLHLWAVVSEVPGSVQEYAERFALRRTRIDGTFTLQNFITAIQAAE